MNMNMEGEEDDGEEEQYERNRGGRKQIKIGTTRRNARERNRVRHINTCFEILRQHIPNDQQQKKLSKVDTLKSAMIYIENLHQLLQSTASSPSHQHQQQRLSTNSIPFHHFKQEQQFFFYSNSNSIEEH